MSVLAPNPVSPIARDRPPHLTRRKFLLGSGVTAAGLALYAGEVARHEIDVIQRPIAIRNLPGAFYGFRIVQISDIHIDEYTEPYFVDRIVKRVNALNPDLVLITGDFVTLGAFTFISANHAIHRCAEILATLTCPLRYCILGNHDVGVGAPLVIDALQRNHLPVLVNQQVPIERNGSRLWLGGVEDPGTSHPDLNLTIPAQPDGPVILMAHEPDYVNDVLKHPRAPLVDLMLAGHSHGGQIRLPFLGPLVLPPMGRLYPEGHYHLKNIQLYVNRGLGTVGLPFRLNCPPEITVITLKPAT
jgi:predicted MPP superfamily phosphohydrolase